MCFIWYHVESMKTTSMEPVSTGVLDKNKEHYLRSKDKDCIHHELVLSEWLYFSVASYNLPMLRKLTPPFYYVKQHRPNSLRLCCVWNIPSPRTCHIYLSKLRFSNDKLDLTKFNNAPTTGCCCKTIKLRLTCDGNVYVCAVVRKFCKNDDRRTIKDIVGLWLN